MSEEKTVMYYRQSWEEARFLVEALERLARNYTLKKFWYEQTIPSFRPESHRVWWWPFKMTVWKWHSETRPVPYWSIEEKVPSHMVGDEKEGI